ncbi:MAG: ABC transporter ATP-binding protein [Gammaproteobacteria bacterium]|nr:ABC transporter ATP-binding protein [Gammaproteobacteria bacterium]
MTESIVQLDHVSKTYGPVTAVDDVSLNIAPGEFVVLLGPSGSGKTTILSMIGGFTIPSSGTVTINGEDMTDTPPVTRPTVTVFQDYALFPHMTVSENVEFGLKMRKLAKGIRQQRTEQSLEIVGLAGFGDRGIHQLSGGQRQRVALARALAVEPAVLLLDEPLGALDLKIRHQMQDELVHLQKNLGVTFVHVTHDQEEAMAIADNIALINEGKIEDYGPPDRIYLRPATLFTARFMGESNIFEGTVKSSREGTVTVGTRIGDIAVSGEGSTGDRVYVSLRPEQICPVTESAEEMIDIGEVRIGEVIFQGTHRLCRVVNTADQTEKPIVFRLPAEQQPRTGDVMRLHAKSSHAVLLKK